MESRSRVELRALAIHHQERKILKQWLGIEVGMRACENTTLIQSSNYFHTTKDHGLAEYASINPYLLILVL